MPPTPATTAAADPTVARAALAQGSTQANAQARSEAEGATARRMLGVLLVLVSAVAFSAKAVVVKLAYAYGVDAVTLLTIRMALALPFFAGLTWYAGRSAPAGFVNRKDVGLLVLCGFVGYYLASLFDFQGLQYISAGLERLILYLYPTIVVLIGALFFRRRITVRIAVALVISYAGVLSAFQGDLKAGGELAPLGALLVFLSAITYAIYLSVGEGLIRKLGTLFFTGAALSISVLAVCVHFAVTRSFATLFQLPPAVYAYGLLLAIVCTFLPAVMLAAGIRRIGSGPAALVGSVGPMSTLILAAIFLGEAVLAGHLVGTALVLLGILIVAREHAQRR